MRVHGADNKGGSWIMHESAIHGLTPEQIKAKYSLPSTPTHISTVAVPAGTRMRSGKVNPLAKFGGIDMNAKQFQLLQRIPDENFKNTKNSVAIKTNIDMEELKEIDIKDLDVKDELDCGTIVVKLYKVPVKYKCNRNITGEDKQGKVLWQIGDINPLSDWSFSSIRPFDKERIIAYNWIGMGYYIDVQTGNLEIVNKDVRPW